MNTKAKTKGRNKIASAKQIKQIIKSVKNGNKKNN